jgi:hypothetical protein
MLAALGLALLLMLSSPNFHPKAAQAQIAPTVVLTTAGGLEIATFGKVDELTSSIKLPRADGKAAQLETLSIVLKKGLSEDLALSSWHQAATTQLTGYKKNVVLIFYNTDGSPVARFNLNNAWPAEYHLSALKAGSSEIIYETVTLTGTSFQRVSPN